MPKVTDIEEYREDQYSSYQSALVDNQIELVKCAGCFDEVEETEATLCSMHDLNEGKKLIYCNTCIEIYKNENL